MTPDDIKSWLRLLPNQGKPVVVAFAIGLVVGAITPIFYPRPYANLLDAKVLYTEDKLATAVSENAQLSTKTASLTSANTALSEGVRNIQNNYDDLMKRYLSEKGHVDNYQVEIAALHREIERDEADMKKMSTQLGRSRHGSAATTSQASAPEPSPSVAFDRTVAKGQDVAIPDYECGKDTSCYFTIISATKSEAGKMEYVIFSNFFGNNITLQEGAPMDFSLGDQGYRLTVNGSNPFHLVVEPVAK